MANRETIEQGASVGAIQEHYDTGNDFYKLWLDRELTYSCALWADQDDTLESAQTRKLDYLIGEAKANHASRVLDIGCGWGSMLSRLAKLSDRRELVGLTLSQAQKRYVDSLAIPSTVVRMESWSEHQSTDPYDAIFTVGALEHFVRPEMDSQERIRIYGQFFDRCHQLLNSGGYMVLQTMAYGRGKFVPGALSSIFPESDLPNLAQLSQAFEPYFELRRLRNDPSHYARTVRSWLKRFRASRSEAIRIAGPSRARHFERFFEAGIRGYERRIFYLYRFTLRRLDSL